jgi:hypothetical protein
MIPSFRYTTWSILFVVLTATGCAEISKKAGVENEQTTKSVPLSLTFAVPIPTGGPPQELAASAPQHRWGMSMLNPPPKTLNAANDIDAGIHGLEQRGTPIAVGQRTLEVP